MVLTNLSKVNILDVNILLSQLSQLTLVCLHTPEKLAVERWEMAPQMKSRNKSKKGRSAALVPKKQEVHAMG